MAQTYDDQEKGGGGENVEDLRRRMGIHLTDEERAQAGDGSLGKQEEQASQDKADDQGEGRKKTHPGRPC